MLEENGIEVEVDDNASEAPDLDNLVPNNGRDANFYVEDAERPCYFLVSHLNASQTIHLLLLARLKVSSTNCLL